MFIAEILLFLGLLYANAQEGLHLFGLFLISSLGLVIVVPVTVVANVVVLRTTDNKLPYIPLALHVIAALWIVLFMLIS